MKRIALSIIFISLLSLLTSNITAGVSPYSAPRYSTNDNSYSDAVKGYPWGELEYSNNNETLTEVNYEIWIKSAVLYIKTFLFNSINVPPQIIIIKKTETDDNNEKQEETNIKDENRTRNNG